MAPGSATAWIRSLFLAAFGLFGIMMLSMPAAAEESGTGTGSKAATPPQTVPKPEPSVQPKTSTKFIPLPIYATLPNEGSTWGLLPVWVIVNPKTERTESIYAPSVSWNRTIGETGTFRWYHYPGEFQSLTFNASVSTHVNRGSFVIWEDEPHEQGKWTETFYLRGQRSIFFRFFGIGPDTAAAAESSHTRVKGDLWYRRGWNLGPHLNLGLRVELARDVVQSETVTGLPSSRVVFAGTPGMGGGAILAESIDLRFDTREHREYSIKGDYLDLSIGPVQGLDAGSGHWMASFDGRVLFNELSWVSGAVRAFTQYVSSPDVPFYYQSTLGGSYLMRGFTEDRFFDQGAWTLELEQRLRAFQTHIYGVVTDWRADPFVAIGQVFHPGTGLVSKVRVTKGIGFRAFVRPNVLGRVDVADGGEGLKFYVELGYPF